MSRDILGEWWLPNREDEKVHGLLRLSEVGNARLELDGAFHGFGDTVKWEVDAKGTRTGAVSSASSIAAGVYEKILGESKREQKVFTLTDCVSINTSGRGWSASRYSLENIRIGEIVEDLQFLDGEDLGFDGCHIEMRHFTSWVNTTGIESKSFFYSSVEDGALRTSQEARALPRQSLNLDDGSALSFDQCLKSTGDRLHSSSITQWFRMEWLFPRLLQPRDIIQKVSDIQDLVSLASHRAAEITSIELLHPDSKIHTIDGTTHDNRKPVKYWFNSAIRDRAGPGPDVDVNDLYFTLVDIGGIENVGDWLHFADANRTALARVMSVIYGADSYLQDKLMNCLVSLEFFDRNLREGIVDQTEEDGYYRSRLGRNIDLAGEPFQRIIGEYAAEWIQIAKLYRNGLAHHLEQVFKSPSTTVYLMTQSAFWLFILCAFRVANFPESVFSKVSDDRRYLFVGEQLKPILAERREENEKKSQPKKRRRKRAKQRGSRDPRFLGDGDSATGFGQVQGQPTATDASDAGA